MTERRIRVPRGARRRGIAAACSIALTVAVAVIMPTAPASAQPGGLVVSDLAGGVTAQALAQSLVGGGLTVSNVTYTGSSRAAGSFTSGDSSIVGFSSGIVLDSGKVETKPGDADCSKGVEGPNTCYEGSAVGNTNSTEFGTPGDADLSTLSGFDTYDASVLQFDFVPTFSNVQFKYVFSSDEYSDYANTQYNDVFGFLVNGTNCALVPGTTDPVSVNTINNGNPFGDTTPHHADLFRDNVRPNGPSIDTEMDGLTTVLSCNATVNPGVVNHMKLAIADASDAAFDSAVFLQAGSLISGTTVSTSLSGGGQSGATIGVPTGTAVTDQATLAGANSATAGGTVTYSVYSDNACTTKVADGGTVNVTNGVVPVSSAFTATAPGMYYWQASYSGDPTNNKATSACTDEVETVTNPTPTNHAPVASDGTVSTPQDTPVATPLSATDADSDSLTYSVVTPPTHGTLSGTAPNLTYTPNAGYVGPDSFTWKANDGKADSNVATESITVTAKPNHAPVASDGTVSTPQDTPVATPLSATDADSDSLTYSVVTPPTHGTLSGTAPNLTYTPNAGYVGPDSFTWKANDGKADSNVATESITVTPVSTGCTYGPTPKLDKSVTTNSSTAVSSLVSPALTTTHTGDLVLAFVSANGPNAATQKVTTVSGGGLSWKLASRSNATYGTSEVWQAYSAKKLTSVKITATLADKPYGGSITVAAFSGAAHGVGAVGSGSGTGTKASASVMPKYCNSLVWAAGHDATHAVKPTPATGQTTPNVYLGTSVHNTYWTQSVTSPSSGKTITVADTLPYSDRWELAAVEIPAGLQS